MPSIDAPPASRSDPLTAAERFLAGVRARLPGARDGSGVPPTRADFLATIPPQLAVAAVVGLAMFAHEANDRPRQQLLHASAGVAVLALGLSLRLSVRLLDGEDARRRSAGIAAAIAAGFLALVAAAAACLDVRIAESFVLEIACAATPIALQLGMLRGWWARSSLARRRRLAFNAGLLVVTHVLLVSTLRPNLCLDATCAPRPYVWAGGLIAAAATLLLAMAAALMVFDLTVDVLPNPHTVDAPGAENSAAGRPLSARVTAREARWNALRPAPLGAARRVGLALSGGGIRSAAVCLGAIARLAEQQRIRQVHYVSSVSGGGWAASAVLARLAADAPPRGDAAPPRVAVERAGMVREVIQQIRHSREYLARGGLRFSADMIRPVLLVLLGAAVQSVIDVFVAIGVLSFSYYAELACKPADGAHDTASAKILAGLENVVARVDAAAPALAPVRVHADHLGYTAVLFDACFLGLVALGLVAALCVAWQLLVVVRLWPWDRRPSSVAAWVVRTMVALGLVMMAAQASTTFVALLVGGLAGAAVFAYVRLSGAKLAGVAAGVFAVAKGLEAQSDRVRGALRGAAAAWQDVLRGAIEAVAWVDDRVGGIWGKPGVVHGDGALLVAAVCGLLYVVVPLLISRNRVSLHAYWRERLSAAFMTVGGRDVGEVRLCDLDPERTGPGQNAARAGWPYPIFNGAVNAPASPDDETRAMGVARFEMTPCFVGGPRTGWASTEWYGDELRLASAVAISAAAVNTQGGASIPRTLRPALATLNLRLGAWVRNPRAAGVWPAFRRTLHFTTMYAVREWLGANDEFDGQVLVSDGGHDDNLGIEALVDRGCDTILCVDAAADPHWRFKDLAGVLRRLRRHGWTHGEVATAPLRPPSADDPAAPRVSSQLALSVTLRHAGWGRSVTLCYAKSGLTANTPFDVLEFARANASFPQQTTADQFFDLEQFDAYVSVGEAVGDALIDEWDRVERAGARVVA